MRFVLVAVVAVGLFAAPVESRGAQSTARPGTEIAHSGGEPGDEPGCGGKSKKTLTDKGAAAVNFTPAPTTVSSLRALPVPPGAGLGAPRQTAETMTFQVTVQLVSAKLEPDHDIHLLISDQAGSGTMITEFPDPTCPAASLSAHVSEMATARAALLAAIGPVSALSYKPLGGTATLTGVGFFDSVHGQRGVAPNGIELHPVLSFKLVSRGQPDSFAILTWTARHVGKWYAERARLRLCAAPHHAYRARLVERSSPKRLVRAFSRVLKQTAACSASTISWRFPATTRARVHLLTIKLSTIGADLTASRTQKLRG